MQMLYVCVHHVSVLNDACCMTCSFLMLVEDERGEHMEEEYSRACLMTALFRHTVTVSAFIICRGLCACTEMV